ncbi:MAG: flagellar biosynthesis protein FlhB [Bacillota bacterium]
MESIAEKRFPATPKRKQDARKKGQVLKSQELTSALMLLALVGVLRFWLPQMLEKLNQVFRFVYSFSHEWDIRTVAAIMTQLCLQFFFMLAPIFLAAFLMAFLVNYLQVGFLLTFEPLKPKLSRLSPIQGVKRMFGVKAWAQLIKALLKVVIIGYFLYAVVRDNFKVFAVLQHLSVRESTALIGEILFEMAWKVALAFVMVAILDFLYQWWEYTKELKMSHEEIKEEYKQMEGDPYIKAEVKKKQRSLATRRMMEDLKQADVVITNPTHLAVAIKYDPAKFEAPYVLAKGQGQIAQKIKELAREQNIVIMENKPLARALYNQVEIGQVVPKELYQAVAEVLAFVYKINRRKKSYFA